MILRSYYWSPLGRTVALRNRMQHASLGYYRAPWPLSAVGLRSHLLQRPTLRPPIEPLRLVVAPVAAAAAAHLLHTGAAGWFVQVQVLLVETEHRGMRQMCAIGLCNNNVVGPIFSGWFLVVGLLSSAILIGRFDDPFWVLCV